MWKKIFAAMLAMALAGGLMACVAKPDERESTSGAGAASGETSAEPVTAGEPEETVLVFQSPMPASAAEREGDYVLTNAFRESDFSDSKRFSRNLALLSFAMAVANRNEEIMGAFFGGARFDNARFSGYDVTPTEDTVAYAFAHRKIGERDLVAVSVRGFHYGAEWIDNFRVGENGYHEGFSRAANAIYDSLRSYIAESAYQNVGLWITGYSRGGGVANVLGSLLNLRNGSENAVRFSESNLYVYTFEAPAGVPAEYAAAGNIHNIVSHEDLVVYVAPEGYGFRRAGTDYDIFRTTYRSDAKAYDAALELPEFSATDSAKNGKTLYQAMLNGLMTEPADESSLSVHTRAEYVENLQTPLGRAIWLLESMSDSRREAVINDLNSDMNRFSLLYVLGNNTENGLYNLMKASLEKADVAFDDVSLKTSCAKLQGVLSTAMKNDPDATQNLTGLTSNLAYIGAMHAPETVYSLLLKYNFSPD